MGLLGSEDVGLGSVLTAAGGTGGGGTGTSDRSVIGKFVGALATGEGNSFSYLADPGRASATASGNEVDPQLYSTSARTFSRLRVTAISGNASLNAYTVELYKNGVATLQAVVVPAGAAAGAQFSDSSHPISFADGDQFDLLASVSNGDIVRLVSAVLEGPAGGGGGGGGSGTISRITSTDGSLAIGSPTGPTADIVVAGTDPFSLMAQRALAFGAGLSPPVDFAARAPFLEDFAGNVVTTSVGPAPGTVTFDTLGNALGTNGRIKAAAAGAASNQFAFACPGGNVGFIGDVVASSYYVEWLVRFKETAANVLTTHAVGIVQATGALNGGSRVVIIGLCGDGLSVPTKWGIAQWNGTDYIVTPSAVAADLSDTVDHYMALGHDSVGHLFWVFVNGAPILSVSDAVMAAHLGPGPYTYLIADQASAAGFTNADKVYMVST